MAPSSRGDAARALASYYQRHMALQDGAAYGWIGSDAPGLLCSRMRQVGVTRERYLALSDAGELRAWSDSQANAPLTVMTGVAWFHSGESGWFAIDAKGLLWHGVHDGGTPRRVAEQVTWAWIGDGADYFIDEAARLHVCGAAHRGQYGNGQLAPSPGFMVTAEDAVQVVAHTGHALHLRRDGAVLGTGGNRFGPLSRHGLGDKADRWGVIFEGAIQIATGARHSAALRGDGTLWAWGQGLAIEPQQIAAHITAVAAGETVTLARAQDGRTLQWDHATQAPGDAPRPLALA